MKTFLGLPITRKPLTDDEYVERIRRDIIRARRYGKWFALFLAVMLIGWGYLIQVIISTFLRFGGNNGQFVQGLAFGVVIGAVLVAPAYHVAYQAVQMLHLSKGDRSSKLLVKYHDMLVELAHLEAPSAQPEQAGQGGTMINTE